MKTKIKTLNFNFKTRLKNIRLHLMHQPYLFQHKTNTISNLNKYIVQFEEKNIIYDMYKYNLFGKMLFAIQKNTIGNLDIQKITKISQSLKNPDHLICDKDKVEEARPVAEVTGQRQEALAHPSAFFWFCLQFFVFLFVCLFLCLFFYFLCWVCLHCIALQEALAHPSEENFWVFCNRFVCLFALK